MVISDVRDLKFYWLSPEKENTANITNDLNNCLLLAYYVMWHIIASENSVQLFVSKRGTSRSKFHLNC